MGPYVHWTSCTFFKGVCFAERSLLHEDAVFEEPSSGGIRVNSTIMEDRSVNTAQSFETPSHRRSQSIPNQSIPTVPIETRQLNAPDASQTGQRSLGGQRHREQTDTLPLTIRSLSKVRIIQASCGNSHLLLLSGTGDCFAFGVGRSGQLGLGAERLFVKKPERVPKLSEIIQIAAGTHHSVALTAEVSAVSCVNI